MQIIPVAYLFLGIAILLEVIGTSFLQKSEQFTKLIPSLIVLAGYGGAFFFLSMSLKSIPIGVAYAMWAGLGIVFLSIISVVFFKHPIDLAGVLGMALIIAGVVIVNLFSSMASH